MTKPARRSLLTNHDLTTMLRPLIDKVGVDDMASRAEARHKATHVGFTHQHVKWPLETFCKYHTAW